MDAHSMDILHHIPEWNAAPLIARSIHKNGARSVMAPCGFCMPLALAIVALAPCVRSVKKAVTRSNLDG